MAVVVVPVLNEKLLLVLLADRKEAERKGLELNDSLGGAESDKDVKGITARGRGDTPEYLVVFHSAVQTVWAREEAGGNKSNVYHRQNDGDRRSALEVMGNMNLPR